MNLFIKYLWRWAGKPAAASAFSGRFLDEIFLEERMKYVQKESKELLTCLFYHFFSF